MAALPVVCLMGATATGKTDIALRLHENFPTRIISVDSALVYRGMDIGTAKPEPEILARAPHRLVDIRDPEDAYSAGEFVADATAEIHDALDAGKLPLLVGGTMLYFRALLDGIADLPPANEGVRRQIDATAANAGWPALHARLADIDSAAAQRIDANDSQRIQRALEVFELTGKTLTELQRETHPLQLGVPIVRLALQVGDRSELHRRIEIRFEQMLDDGLLDEVRRLMARPGLNADSASMRAVGYRQLWSHLAGDVDFATAREQAIAATRQLAKRQLTWMRGDDRLLTVDVLDNDPFDAISATIAKQMDQ